MNGHPELWKQLKFLIYSSWITQFSESISMFRFYHALSEYSTGRNAGKALSVFSFRLYHTAIFRFEAGFGYRGES
jgi:hypothetical protein